MTAFKDELSVEMIEQLGSELSRAWDGFPVEKWRALAGSGLDDMELLERVNHLAEVLALCMPEDFPAAAAIFDEALLSDSFTAWMMLPCGKYVADTGIDHPHAIGRAPCRERV